MAPSKKSGKSKARSGSPNCSSCGTKQEVSYGGETVQYPIFSCSSCGTERNEWKKWWDKYSELWKDSENWNQPKHAVSCLVGFMCAEYFSFYERPFKFSYTSPVPFKDKAFTMARRILAMFDGNARRAANYVKWVYHFKVKTRNYPVTSFGFFASQKFAMEYEHARARSKALRRSTPLPEDFLSWARSNEPDTVEEEQLRTWNDLNGLVTHVQCFGSDGGEGRIVAEAVKRGLLPAGPKHRQLED